MAKRIIFSFCFFILSLTALFAQDSGLQFVKKQYPQLSAMFQKELISEHATYTFAIDVSGTMKKYSEIVIPALNSFVDALPNGDYVRIIRFGTTAKGSENGYLGTINSNLKGDLRKAIAQLYTNPNDDKPFRAHTDIPAVMKEVANALQNSENNMNFVFVLTDFRNDQYGSGEHKIVSKDLKQIYYDLEPACIGKNGRIVALRLPVDVNAAGYCLDQLKNDVFTKVELGYEMQDITSDAALSSWFEELKKQIMVERLRTIVNAENKVADISFATDINIDGDVVASVSWNRDNRKVWYVLFSTGGFSDKLKEIAKEREDVLNSIHDIFIENRCILLHLTTICISKKRCHAAQKGSKFHYFVKFDYIRRLIERISLTAALQFIARLWITTTNLTRISTT